MSFTRTTIGFAAIILSTSWARAQEIYVDSVAGSDSNDGTSPDAPKQTLSGMTGFGARYDVLYLKAGGTYEASGLSVSNAMVTRYGEGEAPLLLATGGGFGIVMVNENGIVDGIKVKGASMEVKGTAFTVTGPNAEIMNCEVDGTGSAMMLGFGVSGEGNYIHHNNVHDLGASVSGDQMGTSGGAEAYMITASNNEIAWNAAVRCESPNTTLNGAEGGCLEIVNQHGGTTISNVSFHHNYCEESVGLFEGCSGDFSGEDVIQLNHAIIRDSYIGYNLSVDAMWLYLLQPVNTDFINVVFEHNTLIHTEKNVESEQGAAPFFTLCVESETVEGVSYGPYTLQPGNVIVRNNVFLVDGGTGMFGGELPDEDHYNNLFAGVAYPNNWTKHTTEITVATAEAGFTEDYRLAEGSVAIDSGSALATTHAVDYDGNAVPQGNGRDMGAFEYCSGAGCQAPTDPATGGTSGEEPGTGGDAPTAGATASTGGADTPIPSTGGADTTTPSTGGSSGALATGGMSSTTPPSHSGGVSSTNPPPSTGGVSGTTPPPSTGGVTGATPVEGSGGITSASTETPTTQNDAGAAEEGGAPLTGENTPTGGSDTAEPPPAETAEDSGCGCTVVGSTPAERGTLLWLLLCVGLLVQRRRGR